MPQELYAATAAGDLDGTERLWLGDEGDPYYLLLSRLVYRNASSRYFLTGPLHIDNGAGGLLLIGDAAGAGLSVDVVDGAQATFSVGAAVHFKVQADEGSISNSGGSTTLFSWSSTGYAVTFRNASGIKIRDTDDSHTLGLVAGSNLTANRTFTLTTGNANRTLDMSIGSITFSIDGTLASNSDAIVPTEKAIKTYVDAAVTGLWDFKGATNCSANPNYPAALKGDSYVVSVAGKIGGASGTNVAVGDFYVAIADNAGGTQASVGTSWAVLEHNLEGALISTNNLSDVASAATARTNLGVGTGDSPQFTGINVGHASDTTVTRASAGDLNVEGNRIFRVGGADVPVADGGTGASDASTARTNLGAQAADADLDAVAASGLAAAWSTTTPTPTAGAGSLTSASSSIRAMKVGRIVFFSATVTITTNGTGAGYIQVALPYASVNSGAVQVFCGRETALTGITLGASLQNNSANLQIVKYDGTYPGASGNVLTITGAYEAAA